MQSLVRAPAAARLVFVSLILVALLVPGLSPGATAQLPVDPPVTLAVTVQPSGEPIPMGESRTATATIQVTCPMASAYTTPVLVSFSVTAEADWMQASVEPATQSVDFQPPDCVAAPTTKEVTATVTVAPQVGAPAFVDPGLVFTAAAGDAQPATGPWAEVVQIEGDFRFDISGEYVGEDGVGRIQGTITNNANGRLLVRFAVLEQPERGELDVSDRVSVPARVTDGNDTATFTWRLTEDGRGAVEMAVRIVATAEGNQTLIIPPGYDVRVLANPRGGTVHYTTDPDEALNTPFPGFVFVLALVAIVAAMRRRQGRAPSV